MNELFLPIIEDVKKQNPGLSKTIDSTHCFAWGFKDGSGVCPEYDCIIRQQCEEAYEKCRQKEIELQIDRNDGILNHIATTCNIEEDKKKRKPRSGYKYQGRPVDEWARTLVDGLGTPELLPSNWSPRHFDYKYKELGRLVMSQTASYHVFLVDSKIICRFWTNAANYALVDLSSVLVSHAQQAGIHTLEVPKNSVVKLSPCTGRMYCEDQETAQLLAKLIKDAYLLKDETRA